MTAVDSLTLPDAPKMNDDFSNYFVINNLPKCKEDKQKLNDFEVRFLIRRANAYL